MSLPSRRTVLSIGLSAFLLLLVISALFLFSSDVGNSFLRKVLRAPAQTPAPFFYTNESYLRDVRESPLNLQDVHRAFEFVFSRLPPTVHVYPTENYYYFRFWTGGQEIWGNLRLDVEDRAKGLISFAYFTQHGLPFEAPLQEPTSMHKDLGPADGVKVAERAPLTYTVTYKGKTVTFLLNELPQTLPLGFETRAGEEFIGRTFDESGYQLVLLYDTKSKGFRFVLDPTAPLPDVLSDAGPNLKLGYRTGFAFFTDQERNRSVLIGVNTGNVSQNNYYDGPFDQLPDNWLVNTRFQEFAQQTYRSLRLDKRGFFLDDKGNKEGNRLALQPHMKYQSFDQLTWLVWHCQNKAPNNDVLGCLTKDPNAE